MLTRFPAPHEIAAFILVLLPFVVRFPTASYRLENGELASFSYIEPAAVTMGAFGIVLVLANLLVLDRSHGRTRLLHIAAIVVVAAIGLFQVISGLGWFLDPAAYVAALEAAR
jgi:hypothetical protein